MPGARNARLKLSRAARAAVRRAYLLGSSQAKLAGLFQCGPKCVRAAVRNDMDDVLAEDALYLAGSHFEEMPEVGEGGGKELEDDAVSYEFSSSEEETRVGTPTSSCAGMPLVFESDDECGEPDGEYVYWRGSEAGECERNGSRRMSARLRGERAPQVRISVSPAAEARRKRFLEEYLKEGEASGPGKTHDEDEELEYIDFTGPSTSAEPETKDLDEHRSKRPCLPLRPALRYSRSSESPFSSQSSSDAEPADLSPPTVPGPSTISASSTTTLVEKLDGPTTNALKEGSTGTQSERDPWPVLVHRAASLKRILNVGNVSAKESDQELTASQLVDKFLDTLANDVRAEAAGGQVCEPIAVNPGLGELITVPQTTTGVDASQEITSPAPALEKDGRHAQTVKVESTGNNTPLTTTTASKTCRKIPTGTHPMKKFFDLLDMHPSRLAMLVCEGITSATDLDLLRHMDEASLEAIGKSLRDRGFTMFEYKKFREVLRGNVREQTVIEIE